MNSRTWKLSLLALVLLFGFISPAQEEAGQESIAKLKSLGNSCLRYAQRNGGKMPASLAELYYKAYVNSLEDFVCPANPIELLHRTEINEKSGYILSPGAEGSGVRAIVQDRTADNNGRKGINIFYIDGSVRWEATPAAAQAEGAGPASGGGGGGGPAAKASPSIPVPLLGLLALLLANIGLIMALVLRRRRPAPSSQKVSAGIEVIYQDGGRKTFEIHEVRTTVGRAEDNSLVIHDPDVSSHHAEIVISEGAFVLRDLGSANGTFLNREKIEVAKLFQGDKIGLGSTKLTIGS